MAVTNVSVYSLALAEDKERQVPMNKGGGRPSEELRHFTNREDEKKVFTAFVNGRDGDNLPLLMFYGVGGIGKT